MRRKLATLSAVVAAAVTATVGVAGPAEAAEPWCPEGNLCIYEHSSYRGDTMLPYSGNLDSRFNDKMTSYWNRSDRTWCFYADSNFRTSFANVEPGAWSYAVETRWNDKLSSLNNRPC
jgi:hypothetical protein